MAEAEDLRKLEDTVLLSPSSLISKDILYLRDLVIE